MSREAYLEYAQSLTKEQIEEEIADNEFIKKHGNVNPTEYLWKIQVLKMMLDKY